MDKYGYLPYSKFKWISSGNAQLTDSYHLHGDIMITKLVDSLLDWPGKVIASHKSAGQPFHLISFLAEIGVKTDFPGMRSIVDKIKLTLDDNGIPTLPVPGDEMSSAWGWALCDAPTILYALVKIDPDFKYDSLKAVDYLRSLSNGRGWPCKVMPVSILFSPPCRKGEACPYATLTMLKLLSEYEDQDSPEIIGGIDFLLDCFEKSESIHPCMFYAGNDFRKLKAPFVWYDILHVTHVLSRFKYAIDKPVFKEMANIIFSKKDENGMYAPESVWRAWNGWEFSYRNLPSEWITLKVLEIQKKLD